ncbi:MAG: alpha/beta hydrolase fold protein [Solirubrobacterales bacterium]|jgi:pimeloyl-ACP methyl ester carboxylesterase|nr:alpha/beta hydrolase fold protein [Solirubrobacterales bacterium]
MAIAASATPARDCDAYGPGGRSAWLDVDWRLHQRWVMVAGHPVNLVDLGPSDASADGSGAPPDGALTPLLFVHGLSGSWQNFLENLPFFADRHRVIALDLPGFGATPLTGVKVSVPAYARLIVELMDVLGLPSACVVGNSMGGFVALELAQSTPERVHSLVLVSPAGLDAREQRRDRLLGGLRRAERLLIAGGTMVATHADAVARRPRLRRATMHLAVRHPERLPTALMAEQIRQGSGKPGFVAAIDALTDHDIEGGLADIRCPTLLYWGRQDRIVPVRDAGRFLQSIPGAACVILEDTGHLAMLERPQRFNADLAAFLAGAVVGAEAVD